MDNLFDIIKIIFENPEEYKNLSNIEKKKIFFIFTRRMSIKYPLQAQVLQHFKINEIATIDFWQSFLRKQYNKVPGWMYTKGIKKTKEVKEKVSIKEKLIIDYAAKYNLDIKSVRDYIMLFPEEAKNEFKEFEKTIE
jgi:hypothetical protein